MEAAGYRELLRPLVDGRRVVLAGGVAAGFTTTAALLRELGATDILVVGTDGKGTGPLPPPDVASWVAVGGGAPTLSEGIHRANDLVREPPCEVLDALAAFDPDRSALAIGTFLNEATELDGRPFLAWRRPAWVALEDKTLADDLWDRAGVARSPMAVVALDRRALHRAARSLDDGSGTVWAADASNGFHGGAELTRWVRSATDVEEVIATFRGRTERVRVMPFVEGIPCSIHGIVFPDLVAVLRPVEMVTLRHQDRPTFFYAGCATFYDPPPAVRAEMESVAQRVGALLRAEVGYLGAFTIDGIVGAAGFVPTELNPRSGAGMGVLLRSQPELPLTLLLDALVGGIPLDYDPLELATLLVSTADACRAGGTWRPVGVELAPEDDRPMHHDANGWRHASETDVVHATLTVGPSPLGGFLRLIADPAHTETGGSFAPVAVEFWDFADRDLGTHIGPLTAAVAAPTA